MQVNEFATIASAIKAAWPNANIMPDKQSKDVWYTMLQDLDYVVCLNAVKQLISTNTFAPSISEIRERCAKITSPEIADWGEAWGEVQRAIRNYGYYREVEALDSMSELTRRCVRRLGWQNICTSDNESADRANFRMIYEQDQKVTMQTLQLPENVRLQMGKIQALSTKVIERLETKPEVPKEPEEYVPKDGCAEELKSRWRAYET